MTTNQATYAAILAMDGPAPRRIDRIRARMSANRTFRSLQNARSFHSEAPPENPGLHLVATTRATGQSAVLHPGDIVYWVACLGGACLLLLCATT